MKTINLIQGDLVITDEDVTLTTLLGSCVAICLWDPIVKVGGMCHYVSAYKAQNDPENYFFGDVALLALKKEMIKKGAQTGRIQAKFYGGANILKDNPVAKKCGEDNIEVGEKFLKENQFKLLKKDVGGEFPRMISFNIKSFEIECKVVQKVENTALFEASDTHDIVQFIYSKTGIDFQERMADILLFINERIKEKGFKGTNDYIQRINNDPEEGKILLHCALKISKGWFTNQEHIHFIKNKLAIAKDQYATTPLKLLSLGCSSGEEVYSHSIYLHGLKKENNFQFTMTGVDIDKLAIEVAKSARYPSKEYHFIPEDKKQYFILEERSFSPLPEYVQNIDFQIEDLRSLHKLNKKFDIIFCHNVLRNFNEEIRGKIITEICSVLNINGFLFTDENEKINDSKLVIMEPGLYTRL